MTIVMGKVKEHSMKCNINIFFLQIYYKNNNEDVLGPKTIIECDHSFFSDKLESKNEDKDGWNHSLFINTYYF